MCTLIFLYRFIEGFPIIALHNRYAPLGTLEEAPRVSKKKFKVYHPLDIPSKGTWIGFNDMGLFMAVTDQHTGGDYTIYRSRGLLLMDVLMSFSKAYEALDYIERELVKGYRKGNFILADSGEAYHILWDERIEVETLNTGVNVFTNLTIRDWTQMDRVPPNLLKYVDMRRKRAIELTLKLKPTYINEIIEELKLIASDHGSEVGQGSICLHNGGDWYMSSSTIMAVSDNLKDSKILYCSGNPCEHQFIDYSRLLSDEKVIEVSSKTSKLAGKRIAVCLTGSVACIESPKLARELRRHGAEVT